MNKGEYSITVNTVIPEEGNVIVSIELPSNQIKLNIRQMAHLLLGGVNLLIKACDDKSDIKDYELMGEITEHLNEAFGSTTDFQDVEMVNRLKIKK